jgi:transcriptional regulator with XRE-family HTH domain
MRERTPPSALGLPVTRRRRAPGLLREEVAQTAGVSTVWYTWMEQARRTSPSPRVLAGLAWALRLDPFERSHLFRLARPDLVRADGEVEPVTGGELQGPLAATLRGLAPHPAYAFDARWDVLDWNEPAARVFGEFGPPGDRRRNVLARLFLDADWRRLFVDWERIASSAVRQFRAATAGLLGDPQHERFVQGLRDASPELTASWAEPAIEGPPAWRKVLQHPAAGRMTFDYATFRPDGAADDVRFTIYTSADPSTGRRLRSLLRDVA